MIANIKSWLVAYYKVDSSAVEAYFRNEDITGFLIIWTIFEQKLFDGSARGKKIQDYRNPKFENLVCNLKEEFDHFFSAYQDKSRFKNLIHEEKSVEKINNILRSERDSLNKEDKLMLLLFVVYRYRNNIFHGNKPVYSWVKYQVEINHCVSVMKTFLEA